MASQEWTTAEVDAARRYAKGARLGPAARRTLARLERRLQAEKRYNARPDVQQMEAEMYERIDQALRDGTRKPSSFPVTRRPVPASPAASAGAGPALSGPRPPVASGRVDPSGDGVGRRTSMDASLLSDAEYRQLLAAKGYDTTFLTPHNDYSAREARLPPTPTAPSLALRLRQDKQAREAAARLEKRTAELNASKIDARSAKPEEVANRLQQLLGPHADRNIAESFRPSGEPLPPPKEPPPPARAADAAARRVAYLRRTGQQIDARRLSGDQLAALLQARGLDAPGGSWGPGTATPPKR